MSKREILFVSSARTAIAKYGGTLKDIPATQLGTIVTKAAVERAGVDPARIGHVVFGTVIPGEPKDAYLSRVAALQAGIPQETPAFNVNRLCGSGLQAIVSAAQAILLNDADIAVAGGAESMSRGIYGLPSARWGARLGDTTLVDFVTGVLQDPIQQISMGITAENVAKRYGITRDMQDALAVESQQRAARAIAEGRFKSQITPVEIPSRKGTVLFDTDENVRADTSLDALGNMRAVFQKDGSVTAGNASTLNDGAAALVLAEAQQVASLGLTPQARLVAYAHAGVEPEYMGIGPVPATRLALKRAGLSIQDMDVIESNEAFAAQACAVAKELDLPSDKTNPNGSGISLGHPIGATGAILVVKLIAELQRTQGRYGLATMCIGGGQGIALILERV